MPMSRLFPDVCSELLNLHGLYHKVVFSSNYYIAHSDTPYTVLPQLDRLNDDPSDQALRDFKPWAMFFNPGYGKFLMRYGPKPADVGPFYAFRGTGEIVGGWRERVFGDLAWGEKQLKFRVPGYRPLAIAPPYGNYGQVKTNDAQIPKLLFGRLHISFPLIFTQDRPPFARRGAGTTDRVGRLALDDRSVDRLVKGAF